MLDVQSGLVFVEREQGGDVALAVNYQRVRVGATPRAWTIRPVQSGKSLRVEGLQVTALCPVDNEPIDLRRLCAVTENEQ